MARIVKRLCMPVGSWQPQDSDKPKIEYRDIGVMIEFESNGNTWCEVKLNADILSPVLFQLAKGQMDRGSSAVRVKLFDVARKTKDNGAGDGADGGAHGGDDEPPPF